MVHYIAKSMRITILVGTMTGTAQLCAQEMARPEIHSVLCSSP